MHIEKYYLFYLLALVSEIIGTVTGFGSSILFVPIASLFFDFKIVLGITAVFHVFSNISKIALFRKGFDKRIVLTLGIPAVISVIIGALLTTIVPQNEIELGMNIILIALSVYLIFNINKKLEKSNRNLIVGGVSSGFLAGLIGTGGALRGLTLSAFNLEKMVFIATSAFIDFGVDSSRAIIYVWNGYFKKEHIIMIPFLIVISLLGSWLGKLLIDKIPQNVFRYLVVITIVVTSVIQFVRYCSE